MKNNMRASIDIGSNSVLLLIAEIEGDHFKDISKKSFITSLGRDLDKNKAFHPDSMALTLEAILDYVGEAQKYGIKPEEIIVTATEASRVAQNSRSFFNQIKNDIGVNVQTITSAAEAYFSTKGILFNSTYNDDVITIMDIGGASTELIKVNVKKNEIQNTISLPIGAVRATQWLDENLFVQNLQKIFEDFRTGLDQFVTNQLFCVAGTMTSLGNMYLGRKEFFEDDVHGLKLKSDDIENLFKHFSMSGPEIFLKEFPFLGKRSASIKGGLHTVYHLIHRLLVKEITISTYGLRYGTLLEGHIREEFLHV